MQITVNGEKQEVAEGSTLAELLTKNRVDNPDLVSVQINGEFVDKDAYAATGLTPGQEVDFLYFMGGGQA